MNFVSLVSIRRTRSSTSPRSWSSGSLAIFTSIPERAHEPLHLIHDLTRFVSDGRACLLVLAQVFRLVPDDVLLDLGAHVLDRRVVGEVQLRQHGDDLTKVTHRGIAEDRLLITHRVGELLQ